MTLHLRRLHCQPRYMERGVYDGVPRYRNPNNIFLFRHTLGRSEELGITRQTCLPESELEGEEDVESAATTAALSLGREVSGKIGMDFSRLVKTSLQSINLDRQVKEYPYRTYIGMSCQASLRVFISPRLSFSVSLYPSPPPPLSLPTWWTNDSGMHHLGFAPLLLEKNSFRHRGRLQSGICKLCCSVRWPMFLCQFPRSPSCLTPRRPLSPTSSHAPQEKVRMNHQRIACAVARVDSQFQEQMSQASATLNGVDRAESGRGGSGGSVVSSVGRGAEKNRELAVMAASDSAKVGKFDSWGKYCSWNRVVSFGTRGLLLYGELQP